MNQLKANLLAGQVQHGIWLNTGSDVIAELAGAVGFDWCLVDCEHGPNAVTAIGPQLRALAATGTPAIVRVPTPEVWVMKQALDMGAQTIMVPLVHDAEIASRMARAMWYPPRGDRGMGATVARASGYGAQADYVRTADDQVCLVVQAESAAAVDNIDAIAAVEGVDAVFIGPADLSADMGYRDDPTHPEVQKAIKHIVARTRAAGKVAGFLAFDPAVFQSYRDIGVTLLGVGGDVGLFAAALRERAKIVRE